MPLPHRWFGLPRPLRFVVAGAVNTAATWAAYLAMLPLVHFITAYSLAYTAGICLGYVLNARLVFYTPLSWRGLASMPGVYAAQYLIGTATLWLMVGRLGMDRRWALLVGILVSLPATFLLTRLVLLGRPRVSHESVARVNLSSAHQTQPQLLLPNHEPDRT